MRSLSNKSVEHIQDETEQMWKESNNGLVLHKKYKYIQVS